MFLKITFLTTSPLEGGLCRIVPNTAKKLGNLRLAQRRLSFRAPQAGTKVSPTVNTVGDVPWLKEL